MSVQPMRVVKVARKGAWFPDVLHDGEPVTDNRITDIQVVNPEGQSWIMTGASFLDILEKELGAVGTDVIFPDSESLARFKAGVFPVPIPSRAHMGMLLTICPDIGFRAVSYGRSIYVGPIPDVPTAPGDAVPPVPPDAPQAPDEPPK
jgi:hypothetical protein